MSSLDLTRDWLNQVLRPYPSRERIVPEILGVLGKYRTLAVKTDAFTFDSGHTALLVLLHGTLPITYRGATYHIPVHVWIPHEYPRSPPMAFVVPTRDMGVRKGREVEPGGRVREEVVAGWWGQWTATQRDLPTLLTKLIEIFSTTPPVYAKPANERERERDAPSRSNSTGSTSQAPASPSRPPPPPARPFVPPPASNGDALPQYRPPPGPPSRQASGAYPSQAPHPQAYPQTLSPSHTGPTQSPMTTGSQSPPVPHRPGHGQPPVPQRPFRGPPPQPQSPASPSSGPAPWNAFPTGYVGVPHGVPPPQPQPPQQPRVQQPPPVPSHAQPQQQAQQYPPQQAQQAQQAQYPQHPQQAVQYQEYQQPQRQPQQQQLPQPQHAPPPHAQQPPQLEQQSTGGAQWTYPAQPAPPPAPAPPTQAPPAQAPPPPVPTTRPPAPDLLSSPDATLSSLPSDAPPTAPRPPPPSLVHLHAILLPHLTSALPGLRHELAATRAQLIERHEDLATGEPAIRDEMARLDAVKNVCDAVGQRLEGVVGQGEARVAELEGRGETGVDEVVCGISIVHNQLIDLVAEDNAISDTIYHVTRALDAERIDLDRYLKAVRALAREQYMKRALIERIQEGLGGSAW